MGIFDFFKFKKEEPKNSKLGFNELDNWLEEKNQVNKEKEKKILKNIKLVISDTASILNEQNFTLQKIDLDDRKEQEKLKGIVLENLSIYSHHLSKLIANLQNLEKESLHELFADLNKIILEFKQRSNIHFEKSTILVGKELGDIKETLNKFSNEVNEILKEDKETLDSMKMLVLVKNKLKELKKFEEINKNILSEIKNIDEKISALQENLEIIRKNMEKIKSGVKYEMHEKEKETAKLKKAELEKEISSLRTLLDFKHLSSIYHSDPKKMGIIHEYESDFNQIFEKNDENSILLLIPDSKKSQVLVKIEEIAEAKKQIQEVFNRKDLLEEDALEIMKINSSIRALESDKSKLGKKLEESNEEILKVRAEIKSILLPMGVKIN